MDNPNALPILPYIDASIGRIEKGAVLACGSTRLTVAGVVDASSVGIGTLILPDVIKSDSVEILTLSDIEGNAWSIVRPDDPKPVADAPQD